MDRAWAPEEDASLPEEDVVELLAMLEDGEIDGEEEEEVQASPPPTASKASLSGAPAASPASAVGADCHEQIWCGIWRASAEVKQFFLLLHGRCRFELKWFRKPHAH